MNIDSSLRNNKKSLVSIIIPVHNSEEYLEECLDSVINQSYRNLEILIVIDNSTDNSLSIAKNFQEKDPRIVIKEINKKNAALARKFGVENVNAEFICFVDSDDIVHRKYVEALYTGMVNNNVDMSLCGLKTFMHNDMVTTKNKINSFGNIINNLPKQFCERYHASSDGYATFLQSMHCKMFRIDILRDIDFSMVYSNILEDNFIMIQVLKKIKSQKIYLIDEPLYFYRIGQESVMSNALYSQIKYKNENINYVELFERMGEFICKTYNNCADVEKYVVNMKLFEYRDALKSAIYDVNRGINTTKDLEGEIKLNKQTINNLNIFIEEIFKSKTYRMSQRISRIYNAFSMSKKS